ncbi:MAG: hypothetical protein IJ780_01075 [Neisseriaceae bacterium]|nr:hypothetical protein [Neisseriaceae bacterium]
MPFLTRSTLFHSKEIATPNFVRLAMTVVFSGCLKGFFHNFTHTHSFQSV